MSDKTFFLAVIAISVAIMFGFMAQCEKERIRQEAEVMKARIEKGSEK